MITNYIYVPDIRRALDDDLKDIPAYVLKDGRASKVCLYVQDMTAEEREIIKAGCLINFNRNRRKQGK